MDDKFLLIKFTETGIGVTKEIKTSRIESHRLLGFISIAEKELSDLKKTIMKKLEDDAT